MANTYKKIKEKEIPVIIRNYRHTSSIKIYFRGNVLNISKSKYLSKKKSLLQLIKQQPEQKHNLNPDSQTPVHKYNKQ